MKTLQALKASEYRAQMRQLALAYRTYIHPQTFAQLSAFAHLTESAAVMLACAIKARKLAQLEGA